RRVASRRAQSPGNPEDVPSQKSHKPDGYTGYVDDRTNPDASFADGDHGDRRDQAASAAASAGSSAGRGSRILAASAHPHAIGHARHRDHHMIAVFDGRSKAGLRGH